MNAYEVFWNRNALAALANIWNTSNARSSIVRSQAEIDRRLRSDPFANGEEISEGLFRIIVLPLAAFYEIVPDVMEVRITNVGVVRPSGGSRI